MFYGLFAILSRTSPHCRPLRTCVPGPDPGTYIRFGVPLPLSLLMRARSRASFFPSFYYHRSLYFTGISLLTILAFNKVICVAPLRSFSYLPDVRNLLDFRRELTLYYICEENIYRKKRKKETKKKKNEEYFINEERYRKIEIITTISNEKIDTGVFERPYFFCRVYLTYTYALVTI